MKCELCNEDAVYMIAVDNLVGSIVKRHVRKFAGRCKECEDK